MSFLFLSFRQYSPVRQLGD